MPHRSRRTECGPLLSFTLRSYGARMGSGDQRQGRAEAIMSAIDDDERREIEADADVERQSQRIESAMRKGKAKKARNGR